MPEVQFVTAIVRRADALLMVRQAGPGEEPVWSVPGGRVELGELATEALERELVEETGIKVLDPGRLAFAVQVDDRHNGYFAAVWTFEVAAWAGKVSAADPDGFVLEAAFLPLEEALEHLGGISWHPTTVRYLRGKVPPGSLWLRRVHPDGRVEEAGPF